jgi:hypothetical protein
MSSHRKLRISFLLNAFIVTLLLVAPIPFFSQIIKDIPLISLFLGEVSFIFLVVLASFPKAGLNEILRIGSRYLFFVSSCFSVMSFLPIDAKFKLFSFDFSEGGMPDMVAVNIIGLIILNTVACLFFGVELNRKDLPSEEIELPRKTKVEDILLPRPAEVEPPKNEISSELKKDVNTLFELYLQDYEAGNLESDEKLENIENALLTNITPKISGAMCTDKQGNVLHDTVFHWEGYPRETLIQVFNRNNENSKELGTGALCQLLLKDGTYWYLVAKYKGNFLMLQTDENDPSALLETGYKVFKAV